jgi:hypothetical protein
VTNNPTAKWIAGQVTDAFPWDEGSRYLIRDRDGAFGPAFTRRIRLTEIRDHSTTPRSPGQDGPVERPIGSICNESRPPNRVRRSTLARCPESLRFVLQQGRTPLSLDKDALDFAVVRISGRIAAIPILGDLHHHYARL